MNEPAGYVEPQRLFACFGGAIGQEACERMLDTDRLKPRLSALLLEKHQLNAGSFRLEDEIEEADRIVALSSPDELDDLALQAGAVYWSDSFAGTILKSVIATLQEEIGEALYAFAVANRDLSGPVRPLVPLEGIRERIFADGWHCLGAWCHDLPAEVGTRVRLKLPPDDVIDQAPDPAFAHLGAAIIRRVAGVAA